ncbi:MAG: EFR1 family ferrodoxin [Pelovirga sp.]
MVNLIYFSPTKTTEKIVSQIAAGIADADLQRYDLTRMSTDGPGRISAGTTIIGVPVYAGRVPEIVLERLAQLQGDGLPAVLVVVYGNREFEDALRELTDVVTAKGFHVVAAATFVGEHSYSTAQQPIAAKRPDQTDLEHATAFGAAIRKKLSAGKQPIPLTMIPGNVPYREGVVLGQIAPETIAEQCVLCGECASVCPTFAIRVTDQVLTQVAQCVMCCACVKSCPHDARVMSHPVVAERRTMLAENFRQRKEPQWFL